MVMVDCHTHSVFSPDAENTVGEMCERAIERGLSVYAITDHCECNRYYKKENYNKTELGDYNSDELIKGSFNVLEAEKERLCEKLKLLIGIELGQATFDTEVAYKAIADSRIDYVIGSMHQAFGFEDFCFLRLDELNVDALLENYYNEVYKLCELGCFDSLGHLTYPLRYITGDFKISPDMKLHEEKIRMSLKLLSQKGKALEINTSGLFQNYGKIFPPIEYVKMFREYGGELITFGSDAHCVRHLGFGIEKGIELASQAGFKYGCYYEKRKPVMFKLG